MRRRLAGAVLISGGAIYALAVGGFGLTFNVTPFVVGASAGAAGIVSGRRRLLLVALPLIGWGTAVLAVREGPVADEREPAAFLIGTALGLLAAERVSGHRHSLRGSILTVLTSGLAFYLAYDWSTLGRWPLWSVVLVGWGVTEMVRNEESALGDG